jgi:hypothetical protein
LHGAEVFVAHAGAPRERVNVEDDA